MRPSILLVGEHPFGCTGNANMLSALLCDINPEEFDVSVFTIEPQPIDPTLQIKPLPFRFFPAAEQGDPWGNNRLLKVLSGINFDIVLMVGIDIWQYFRIMGKLSELRDRKKFKWGWLFPFDIEAPRPDWTHWMNMLDFPCVYSQYGFDSLKDLVPKLRNFRPPLNFADQFVPLSEEDRLQVRHESFPNMADTDTMFGFVGPNQFRKDPQALISGFAMLRKNCPDARLYLHTDLKGGGVYNLRQHITDQNFGSGVIYSKASNTILHPNRIGDLYNCFDCLVNCSLQEGLSWTPLEAMLCGVPVIASETTSQTEIVKDAGILVPLTEHTYMPLVTESGESMLEARKCHPGQIASAMHLFMANKNGLRKTMRESGLKKAKEWLAGVSNISDLFREVLKEEVVETVSSSDKEKAILFAQHSAAGDVFMTTRCFKGIKKRHPDLPLHYMTMPAYKGVIEGNPHVEKIIDWDENLLKSYQVVYNPHGDRIAPGHWGRNCNSILSDFYWKILRVKPDDFYIVPDKYVSEIDLPPYRDAFIVVHTTGGDPQFRTYKYMKTVCSMMVNYHTIQVGGKNDYPAGADYDLRGKLSYRQTAYIMSRATAAVTVDSFVSHLAGALGIPQVCLFGCGNYQVVRPNQMKGTLVCMVPDYINDCDGLGPCSASVRDCSAPCTGKHDPKDVFKLLSYILGDNENHGYPPLENKNRVLCFQSDCLRRVE